MCALGGLGNEFLHDHVHHGAGGEGQQVGECHAEHAGQQQERDAGQETHGSTRSPAISIDGISSDHTLAATITPLAKPSSVFCILF